MWLQTATPGATQTTHLLVQCYRPSCLALLQTIPICYKITLAEGSSILDTGVKIAVQAINLSTPQHGFIAKASISRPEQLGPLAVLYFLSSSLAGVGVSLSEREPHSVSAKGAGCPGSGPTRPVAARCAEDKLDWMYFSSNLCANSADWGLRWQRAAERIIRSSWNKVGSRNTFFFLNSPDEPNHITENIAKLLMEMWNTMSDWHFHILKAQHVRF